MIVTIPMIDSLLSDFLVRAALGAIGVALTAAPLGCFIVWRRMAYVGDATAHGSVLGVAIALAIGVPVLWGTLGISLCFALVMVFVSGRRQSLDSLLGVMAFSALALGVVVTSLLSNVQVDLVVFLFGDVLAVSRIDLLVIWGTAVVVTGVMYWRWDKVLLSTLSADLAVAAQIKPKLEQLIVTLGLAVVIAVSIKVIGAILIGALLIIPASSARQISNTPESMVLWAAVFGVSSAALGLFASFHLDTQAGPTIVCAAAFFFICTFVMRPLLRADP